MHAQIQKTLVFIKITEEFTDLVKKLTVLKMHRKEREQRTANQFKMVTIQILQKCISYLHDPLVILLIPYADSSEDAAKLGVLFEIWPYFIILILQVVKALILS